MLSTIPTFYRIFFAIFEPATTFAGFIYAWFFHEQYFAELVPEDSLVKITSTGSLILLQIGNLYLILFFVSIFIWRSTEDETVLRALTWALLFGDIGHIYTIGWVQGFHFLLHYWRWNALAWGNIGITVLNSKGCIRICD